MRYVATETCFVNNAIHQKGEEFDYSGGPIDWAVPKSKYKALEPDEPDTDPEAEPEPDTLSAYQGRSALHGMPTQQKRGPGRPRKVPVAEA